MRNAADIALQKLEDMMAGDPILRDVVTQALPRTRRAGQFVPEVDVLEGEAEWVVVVEVPGVPKDRLSVELLGNRLVISGEKPARHGAGHVKVGERRKGPFKREFIVPWSVEPGEMRAKLQDGLLTVRLPRARGGGGRQIVVE